MVAFTGNHLTYKAVVENLHVLDFDYYFKITDALLQQRLPEIMITFDDILKKGFDAHNFINNRSVIGDQRKSETQICRTGFQMSFAFLIKSAGPYQ
jgi:hypothetical protein